MPDSRLSIILPVLNNQENLDRILSELTTNSPEKDWEVIIVDDGSSPALELPPETPSGWTLLRHDTRKGAASARNTGAAKANGEYIIFLSVFLRIPNDYIARMKGFIKDHDFDVAQHLLVKPPDTQADHFQAFLADQKGRLQEKGEALPVKNTQFAAAVIRKDSFDSVGGFDEKMDHYGGHELDLAYRLDKAGYIDRITIPELPLERIKLEAHEKVRSRLEEYGRVGLPSLLKKHPALKTEVLIFPGAWSILSLLGITRFIERRILKKIKADELLSRDVYRLYLHLVVRNAWDAR